MRAVPASFVIWRGVVDAGCSVGRFVVGAELGNAVSSRPAQANGFPISTCFCWQADGLPVGWLDGVVRIPLQREQPATGEVIGKARATQSGQPKRIWLVRAPPSVAVIMLVRSQRELAAGVHVVKGCHPCP